MRLARSLTRTAPFALGLAALGALGLASSSGAFAQAEASAPAPIACYERADDRTLLVENDIERLCAGTKRVAGPVDCYEAGSDATTLSNVQLIELCRCALGTRPVRCFEAAVDRTDVLDDQAIDLCRPIEVRRLGPDCVPLQPRRR